MDDRKEWYNVWTRSKRRKCQADIPSVLQVKYKQAVSTKMGRSWSESSSSGECENTVLARKAQWAKVTELRELRDEVTWYEGERTKQWVQGNPTGAKGRFEENKKMEVDEEVDSKKKLDQPTKELLFFTIAKDQ